MKKPSFYLWSTRKPNGQPVTVSRRGNLLRQQIGTRPDPNWPEQLPDTQEAMAPAEALPIQLTWLNWLRDNLQENLRFAPTRTGETALRWVADTRKEIQEAEAVLRKIEDALAQEAYQKTLYKDED